MRRVALACAIALALGAGPALADGLPYAPGEFLVEDRLLHSATGAVLPNDIPEAQRACLIVEDIGPT